MAIKKCKECGAEISSSAKVCPNCGKKQKKPVGIIILVIVIILIIIACAGGSDTQESKTTLTSESETTENIDTSEEKSYYIVGEVYEDDNIAIKFVSVDENFTGYSQYATVTDGYKVIKLEFEFENVGDSDQLASAYDFDCYADGYDCESFWSVDDSGFSSTLSAGKKAKGNVYFEVPIDATTITVEYELNYWTNERIEFLVK